MATNKKTRIATETGSVELDSRPIPYTCGQLSAVMHEKGSWSLTHVPSGFAIVSSGSRERCFAVGQWFWGAIGEAGREAMSNNPQLPKQMSADKSLRDMLSPAGIRCREIERNESSWPISAILASEAVQSIRS